MFTPGKPPVRALVSRRPATLSTAGKRCTAVHADTPTLVRLRSQLVSDRTAAALAETFRLLGDPTRVRLLDALAQSELCVCNLASIIGLSESAVSHQLRLLRGARLVRARRSGRLVFYALDDRHILTLLQQGSRHVREATGTAR
ncbi:MAG: metalloregulator ArsR/SmtB family transcription factor [Luteitalea sp.]|nr:metalloregulator ArsR/SmtB family transcription factor [Luteitalea sp.]